MIQIKLQVLSILPNAYTEILPLLAGTGSPHHPAPELSQWSRLCKPSWTCQTQYPELNNFREKFSYWLQERQQREFQQRLNFLHMLRTKFSKGSFKY